VPDVGLLMVEAAGKAGYRWQRNLSATSVQKKMAILCALKHSEWPPEPLL
jgi:hypothetical protein